MLPPLRPALIASEIRSTPPSRMLAGSTVSLIWMIAEARRLNIPIIAMCDTNSDPDVIDFPIPSNDDAIRAIQLMTGRVADAVLEGIAVGEVEQQFQQSQTGAPSEDAEQAEAAATQRLRAPDRAAVRLEAGCVDVDGVEVGVVAGGGVENRIARMGHGLDQRLLQLDGFGVAGAARRLFAPHVGDVVDVPDSLGAYG